MPTETRQYAPYGTRSQLLGSPQTEYGYTGEPLDDNGLIYLRARYYSPALGVVASLDPSETSNRYGYVLGNPVNGAVGELLSLINGYNYVGGNPVNRVDLTGMCPENLEWWDAFGWRCRFLAEGLAARTGQLVENFMWMDYGQLEAMIALGTAAGVTGGARQFVDNAAIIPRLFREDPVAALQALQQFACQNRGTVQGFFAAALIASAEVAAQAGAFGAGSARVVAVGGASGGLTAGRIGVAVAGGIILAVGGLILWDELTRPQLGSNILEGRITPRSGKDWDYLSRELGVDRNTLSDRL